MRSSKQSVSAERFGEYGEKGSSLSEGKCDGISVRAVTGAGGREDEGFKISVSVRGV